MSLPSPQCVRPRTLPFPLSLFHSDSRGPGRLNSAVCLRRAPYFCHKFYPICCCLFLLSFVVSGPVCLCVASPKLRRYILNPVQRSPPRHPCRPPWVSLTPFESQLRTVCIWLVLKGGARGAIPVISVSLLPPFFPPFHASSSLFVRLMEY